MFKRLIAAVMLSSVSANVFATAQTTQQDPGVQYRIDAAIKSGYSVADCRDGECHDYETGEVVLIQDYDKDGFYIYWDENKQSRPDLK